MVLRRRAKLRRVVDYYAGWFELFGGETREENADSFDERQKHASNNSASSHSRNSVSRRENATCSSAADYRVPGILLLSEVYQRAVDRREHPAPDGEASGEYRRSLLDCHETAGETFAQTARSVSESLYALENCSSYRTHGERSTTVVDDPPRAWFSSVLLHSSSAQ